MSEDRRRTMRDSLDQLHGEVSRYRSDDPHVQERVDRFGNEVRTYMDDEDSDPQSIRERMLEAQIELQEDHPTLARAINAAITIIDNAGL